MLIVYNLIYFLFLPLLILRDFFVLKSPKFKTILMKLGFYLGSSNKKTIWLHGVSLGEIKILTPLAKRLSKQGMQVVVSSSTNTGRDELEKVFTNSVIKTIVFPYDVPIVYKKIFNQLNVEKVILFESEFWPNLVLSVPESTKLISLNTSISDKSFQRMLMLKNFSEQIFKKFNRFLVQSLRDKERLAAFGVSNINIIGNIKVNSENYVITEEVKEKIIAKLSSNKFTVVLGSSHDGEEDYVINALHDLDLVLVIAPRHPERINGVKRLLKEKSIGFSLFSELEHGLKGKVIIYDQIGSLFELYAAADLAVVAGSIVFDKGHNFIEPIYAGTPSITGIKLKNYSELKKLLCDKGIIKTFSSQAQLRDLVNAYTNALTRQEYFQNQQTALTDLSGSYDQVVDILNES